MDKKDLYMTLAELLNNYTRADIDDAFDNIAKLYVAESVMGNKKKEIKYASSKKKTIN
tara:strand:- start:1674 stop:1847 length:174 start_codon:yes stop_codon:yes gene_type:complete